MTMYLYYFVGMYITTVLLYSDSCLYWCLAYICEGIFALRMYVTIAIPYCRIGALLLLREHTLLWRSTKHLGSQTLIHSINQSTYLIRGIMLTWSWIILFQEFAIDRHHECVTVWICDAISSIWVDCLHYKRSFYLGWNLPLALCVMIMGYLTAKTKSPLWKTLFDLFVEAFWDSGLV